MKKYYYIEHQTYDIANGTNVKYAESSDKSVTKFLLLESLCPKTCGSWEHKTGMGVEGVG